MLGLPTKWTFYDSTKKKEKERKRNENIPLVRNFKLKLITEMQSFSNGAHVAVGDSSARLVWYDSCCSIIIEKKTVLRIQ
jgi:hypothetical protein